MTFDSWKTQCDEARYAYEIKREEDVTDRDYKCEIDPCMKKAVVEVSMGHTQYGGMGTTYLLCEDHEDQKWNIYFEDLQAYRDHL